MDLVTVTIPNWDKFNLRKDYKHPTWFALSNSILENEATFALSAEELKAWIYVLCRASKSNSGTITIDPAHASRVCAVKVGALSSALKKLETKQSVQITNGSVQKIHSTDRQTDKHTHVDLDAVYFLYPRKQGKTAGLKKLAADLRSGATLGQVRSAIEHYKKHLEKNRTDPKFVKMFSTFIGEWRDWLDPHHGSTDKIKKASSQYVPPAELNLPPKEAKDTRDALGGLTAAEALKIQRQKKTTPGGK